VGLLQSFATQQQVIFALVTGASGLALAANFPMLSRLWDNVTEGHVGLMIRSLSSMLPLVLFAGVEAGIGASGSFLSICGEVLERMITIGLVRRSSLMQKQFAFRFIRNTLLTWGEHWTERRFKDVSVLDAEDGTVVETVTRDSALRYRSRRFEMKIQDVSIVHIMIPLPGFLFLEGASRLHLGASFTEQWVRQYRASDARRREALAKECAACARDGAFFCDERPLFDFVHGAAGCRRAGEPCDGLGVDADGVLVAPVIVGEAQRETCEDLPFVAMNEDFRVSGMKPSWRRLLQVSRGAS